jgi:hypothetical protein
MFCLTVLVTTSAWAKTQYMEEYHREENRRRFKELHGYSPYFFSDDARSRYSYSGEEKGHYILGETDKEWPFDRLFEPRLGSE